MRTNTIQLWPWMVIATAIGLLCCPAATAKKPPKPPAPADPKPYMLVDLLGFESNGYQSQGQFITDRGEDGDVLIGGNSRLFLGGDAEFRPALWHVDINGDFPETDPVNLGTPPCGGGVEPRDMNSLGIMVARTRRAVEKDDDENWVFPEYVIIPGQPFIELPNAFSRNTQVEGINDAGEIVGTFEDLSDPEDPASVRSFAGIWQLHPDDSISGPTYLGELYPYGINNHGVILADHLGWPAIAWFENGSLRIRDLDISLEFWAANVDGLNDCARDDPRLTVIGTSRCDETGDFQAPDRGFIWRPNDTADPTILGTLGGWSSVPLGVNTQGDVVGWSDTKNQGQQAFLFKDGVMSNLNSLAETGKATLKFALDINDDGDIVGFMGIPRPVSEQRGFLLRPISP